MLFCIHYMISETAWEWEAVLSWLQIYQNSKNISIFYHSVTYFYNFHIPAGFFSLIFRPFGYRLAQLHHLQTLHLPGFDKGILNLIFEFFFLNLNEKSLPWCKYNAHKICHFRNVFFFSVNTWGLSFIFKVLMLEVLYPKCWACTKILSNAS